MSKERNISSTKCVVYIQGFTHSNIHLISCVHCTPLLHNSDVFRKSWLEVWFHACHALVSACNMIPFWLCFRLQSTPDSIPDSNRSHYCHASVSSQNMILFSSCIVLCIADQSSLHHWLSPSTTVTVAPPLQWLVPMRFRLQACQFVRCESRQ
jgi:hypothetical protein